MSPQKPGPGRRATSRKGWFAQGRLPVSESYVPLHRRRGVLWLGLGLVLAFVAWLAFDFGRSGPQLLSGGQLSSAHAAFAADCSACHEPMAGVVAEKCVDCHTVGAGAGGQVLRAELPSAAPHHFALESHARRFGAAPSALGEGPGCAGCHVEHLGRSHSPAEIEDSSCRSCHELSRFETDHPQFDAVAEVAPGPAEAEVGAPLAFTHVFHVAELLKGDSPLTTRGLEPRGSDQVDAVTTCAYCHEPEASGAGFEPLRFDRHCGACHLIGTQSTDWLTLADRALEDDPERASDSVEYGVYLLDGSDGGRRWANAADLSERRGRVRKVGIRHADPWILENLRRLREVVYQPAPLADLLPATPSSASPSPEQLYREAIAELETRISMLEEASDRSTRSELATLRRLLDDARARLAEQRERLSADAFEVELRPMPLSNASQARLEEITTGLMASCTECHRLERLTVVQAPADLSVLRRARFDHAAHVLQVGCLDCHDRIPELAALQRGESVDAELAADASDRAETVNLPGVTQCSSCHRAEQATATCTTCHDYHPQTTKASPPLPVARQAALRSIDPGARP